MKCINPFYFALFHLCTFFKSMKQIIRFIYNHKYDCRKFSTKSYDMHIDNVCRLPVTHVVVDSNHEFKGATITYVGLGTFIFLK